MATIEKLFNFEERQLAQDTLGQSEDISFGSLMPTGYGAIGAGVNKLGRNIFGNNDPVLKERAAIEGALLETQNELTPEEMADPSVLYPTMMAKLKNLNVNPKMILGLQQIMQDQIATKITAEGNQAYKQFTVNAAKEAADAKILADKQNRVEKKNANLIKSFKTPIDEGHRLVTDYISQAFPDLDGPAQRHLFNKIQRDAGELYINNDITVPEAIAIASANLKDKYVFENNWFKDDKLTPKEAVPSATLPVNLDKLLDKYKPKTGN